MMTRSTPGANAQKATHQLLAQGHRLKRRRHRRDDWQQALRLGEGVVALENGALIGTILCWRWGPEYATLGLVIVDDAQQGRGIGRQLMQRALEKLAGSNVRLHATAAGQPLYARLGFVATGHVEQHQSRELRALSAPACAPGQ